MPPLPLPQFGLKPNYSTAPPINRKLVKGLLSMAMLFRARPRVPHSHSVSSGNFHKPLILIHQRADRMETAVTEN